MNEQYEYLIVNGEPEGPCVIVLSRWDGQRAKVFPSQRDFNTREAVVLEPGQVPDELALLDELVRCAYRVDFVAPGKVQEFVDKLALEIEAARSTVGVVPRGFSDAELEKMGLELRKGKAL